MSVQYVLSYLLRRMKSLLTTAIMWTHRSMICSLFGCPGSCYSRCSPHKLLDRLTVLCPKQSTHQIRSFDLSRYCQLPRWKLLLICGPEFSAQGSSSGKTVRFQSFSNTFLSKDSSSGEPEIHIPTNNFHISPAFPR